MRYDFENFFEEKLRDLADSVAGGDLILDVGGGERFQKGLAKYKNVFDGKNFKTLDFSQEYKPDIVGDIHNLPLADGSAGAILCKSVLEHVKEPSPAMAEMHRVLKPGGKILLYTHFVYPYHGRSGIYKDYFRFTEDGLRYLFKDFKNVEIKKQGGYFRALCFFMPMQAHLKPIWEPVAYFLDKVFATEKRTTTCGFYVYAVK